MMYPKEYDKYLPVADQVINDMQNQYGNEDIYLDADMLNQMVEEAVRRSKNMDMDMDMDNINKPEEKDGDAIPTILDFGRRPTVIGPDYDYGYDHEYHHGYDPDPPSSSLADIYKILLLQRLLGGGFYGGGYYSRRRRGGHGGRRRR